MRAGIGVGFAHARHRPVGRADAQGLTGADKRVERFHDLIHAALRVVAVEHVDVHMIRAQAFEGLGEIVAHVLRVHARVAVGVAALGDDGDLIAVFARVHPRAQHAFALAVVLGGVERGDAGGESAVEQGALILAGDHGRKGAAKDQARDRAGYPVELYVLHAVSSCIKRAAPMRRSDKRDGWPLPIRRAARRSVPRARR